MIKKFLFIFLIFTSLLTVGQRTNTSPYSFFGIGENYSPKTVEQSSMGGIGAAFKTNNYLNFINPAGHADLRFATYALGGEMNDLTIKDNSGSQSSTSFNLKYISLGFPIGEKAGVSFGLQPQSSVGYGFLNQTKDSDGNTTEFSYFEGEGGTSRLYGGFGINVAKGFSLGFEAAFIFGNIENNILNQKQDVFLATFNDEKSSVRATEYKFGAQFQREVYKGIKLNAGAVFKLENEFSRKGTQQLYSGTFTSTGTIIPRDTLVSTSISGKIISPLKTTLGIGLGKANKWYAGINYEFQEAIKNNGYQSVSNSTYGYGDSNRISFGGFYLPRINSISSYWDRVTYRGGMRFEKTGLLVKGSNSSNNFTSIDDFGISFGLGLPVGNRLSNINLGFEYGQKGTTSDNLIKENYFNLRLSLSLNDKWFRKRQID